MRGWIVTFFANLVMGSSVLTGQTAESRPAGEAASESRPATQPAAGEITFELLPPPARESRPAASAASKAVAIIRITNKSSAPVTLWPFVSLHIEDAKGDEQRPSSNRGRFGFRKQDCFLEAVRFTTLEPGKSIDWPVQPELYTHDPTSILGWKLKPGKYALSARYAFSRADFISRCKLGCERHADPRAPWNLAPELQREASLEFSVK